MWVTARGAGGVSPGEGAVSRVRSTARPAAGAGKGRRMGAWWRKTVAGARVAASRFRSPRHGSPGEPLSARGGRDFPSRIGGGCGRLVLDGSRCGRGRGQRPVAGGAAPGFAAAAAGGAGAGCGWAHRFSCAASRNRASSRSGWNPRRAALSRFFEPTRSPTGVRAPSGRNFRKATVSRRKDSTPSARPS